MNAVLQLARHKLSVEDYHRMGETGILAPDSRIELIEGELIDMAPIGSVHISVVNTLSMFFARAVGDSVIVSTQNSIRLLPNSEPQPDLALLKPRADRYRKSLPTAADVLLLIEVADTTADYDRRIKLPLYARYGVEEFWLIDLKMERVEAYTSPDNGAYGGLRAFGKDDVISPSLLPGAMLPLSEIWPA